MSKKTPTVRSAGRVVVHIIHSSIRNKPMRLGCNPTSDRSPQSFQAACLSPPAVPSPFRLPNKNNLTCTQSLNTTGNQIRLEILALFRNKALQNINQMSSGDPGSEKSSGSFGCRKFRGIDLIKRFNYLRFSQYLERRLDRIFRVFLRRSGNVTQQALLYADECVDVGRCRHKNDGISKASFAIIATREPDGAHQRHKRQNCAPCWPVKPLRQIREADPPFGWLCKSRHCTPYSVASLGRSNVSTQPATYLELHQLLDDAA